LLCVVVLFVEVCDCLEDDPTALCVRASERAREEEKETGKRGGGVCVCVGERAV
jgi:hypothetical protein